MTQDTHSVPPPILLSVARYYALQKTHAPQLCRAGVLLLYHHLPGASYRWAGHRGTHRLLIDFFTAREGQLTRVIRFSEEVFRPGSPYFDATRNGLANAMIAFEKAYLEETPPPPVVTYTSQDNPKFDKPKPIKSSELQALLELVKANLEYIQSRTRKRSPFLRARSSALPPKRGKPSSPGKSEISPDSSGSDRTSSGRAAATFS